MVLFQSHSFVKKNPYKYYNNYNFSILKDFLNGTHSLLDENANFL
jgi:hypothetical protein